MGLDLRSKALLWCWMIRLDPYYNTDLFEWIGYRPWHDWFTLNSASLSMSLFSVFTIRNSHLLTVGHQLHSNPWLPWFWWVSTGIGLVLCYLQTHYWYLNRFQKRKSWIGASLGGGFDSCKILTLDYLWTGTGQKIQSKLGLHNTGYFFIRAIAKNSCLLPQRTWVIRAMMLKVGPLWQGRHEKVFRFIHVKYHQFILDFIFYKLLHSSTKNIYIFKSIIVNYVLI